MGGKIDLTNKRFGRLVTLYPTAERRDGRIVWVCKCDCGNMCKATSSSLNQGNRKSCGCLSSELTIKRNVKHGLAARGKQPKLYGVWKSMRQRCDNEKCSDFKYYGALGVKYCDEWNDYAVFEQWAKNNGYNDGLTLDRIDGSQNYEPDNCRFITIEEQQRNKSSNIVFTYKGETACLSYFAEKYCIPYARLAGRICTYGWDISDAIELPIYSENPKRRIHTSCTQSS